MLVCVLDEASASASAGAAVFAALVGLLGREPTPEHELGLALVSSRESTLARVARTCARRGLAASVEGDALIVGGRRIPLVSADVGARRVNLHGETPAELLAAAPLLEAIERGPGLRWATLSTIEGRDEWQASVDLCERQLDARTEVALQRRFPAFVGRLALTRATGPQAGAALHLSALLGTGASVEGLRDLLATPPLHDHERAGPRLRPRPGIGSADCLGSAEVLVDLDAIAGAGPLVRIVAYYDPPALVAGELLRTCARSRP